MIAKSPASHSVPKRYYGKYRGLVVENIDPMLQGRIIAQVPDVLGEIPSSWCMPCVPATGIQSGVFAVPPMGSQVWIEFEQGNPDYPIWTGGFWGTSATIPLLALAPPPIPGGQNIVMQTTGQNTIQISDTVPAPFVGGVTIKGASPTGPMIVVNDTGIYMTCGPGLATIIMTGTSIIMNEGALAITGP